MPETAVLFGKNSDIGKALAERLVRDGWDVLRIGREESFPMPPPWDLYISAVGTVEPIGPFFGLDFEEWQGSFIANSLLQLSVLHAIWPYRRKDKVVDAMFMAGGGTNGPFTNYSAYAAAKITLIKMCELIDDEEAGINAFIIGPGFVNTKIHQQTVKAGPEKAGRGYEKALNFMNSGPGTSMDRIYENLCWCMKQGKAVAGGRNFSTIH